MRGRVKYIELDSLRMGGRSCVLPVGRVNWVMKWYGVCFVDIV